MNIWAFTLVYTGGVVKYRRAALKILSDVNYVYIYRCRVFTAKIFTVRYVIHSRECAYLITGRA